MADLTDPVAKIVGDLANDLTLARDDDPTGSKPGRGRAIFLVGAGCSVSAGIRAAAGVARHCACKLAQTYSGNNFSASHDPDEALDWLVANGKIKQTNELVIKKDGSHWSRLYSYFFEDHLKSPNQQREVINDIIDDSRDGLNWAHACLGELVNKRFVHTVLTTNFDQLVLQGIIRTGVMPVTADGLEALNRITGKPKRPQVVHLHGSMHTYNLRNSRTSLNETSSDHGALSMIQTLLQQCDLLVVVGYGGGEEGVMEMLQEAVAALPQLVIYWVTYEKGIEVLSSNARKLLSGENKFTIWGGSADKFFGDLMAELGLGQPDWISDPITALVAQGAQLQIPERELEDVRILISGFKDRIDFAHKNRWPGENEIKIKAAEKRARGEYEEARDLLETVNRKADHVAARMHALNLRSLFEQDPSRRMPLLDEAIKELTDLLDHTSGHDRLDNALAICEAELAKSEFVDTAERSKVLEHVVELARDNLITYTYGDYGKGHARLNLHLAQALQGLGEPSDDGTMLKESQTVYEAAIDQLNEHRDSSGRALDAKSGLAAVLQVLGEISSDSSLLRKSVALHRELVEASRGNDNSIEEAGPLENLANCLMALAKLSSPEEVRILKSEALSCLSRASRIYQRNGHTDQERLAKTAFDKIETSND